MKTYKLLFLNCMLFNIHATVVHNETSNSNPSNSAIVAMDQSNNSLSDIENIAQADRQQPTTSQISNQLLTYGTFNLAFATYSLYIFQPSTATVKSKGLFAALPVIENTMYFDLLTHLCITIYAAKTLFNYMNISNSMKKIYFVNFCTYFSSFIYALLNASNLYDISSYIQNNGIPTDNNCERHDHICTALNNIGYQNIVNKYYDTIHNYTFENFISAFISIAIYFWIYKKMNQSFHYMPIN